MPPSLSDILQLEMLQPLHFRSRFNRENFRKNLFGGQVLAQGLMAACASCEDFAPHSLHGYFLLPGKGSLPVDFEVKEVRNGRSFANRQVSARQDGREIFVMLASFHRGESGFSHQPEYGNFPDPDILAAAGNIQTLDAHLPASAGNHSVLAIDVMPIDRSRFDSGQTQAPSSQFWLRCRDPLTTRLSQWGALAFVSDVGLLASALLPHASHLFSPEMTPATMDHATWFHEADINLNDWTLFMLDSPWAGHARGLGRSQVFSREGKLIASASQEGLIRTSK